jgi:hypothetical protein
VKTTSDQLLYLLLDEAQDLLDKQDPGYEIAVAYSGTSVILDPNKQVVMVISPKGAAFDQVA